MPSVYAVLDVMPATVVAKVLRLLLMLARRADKMAVISCSVGLFKVIEGVTDIPDIL